MNELPVVINLLPIVNELNSLFWLIFWFGLIRILNNK